MQQKSKRVYLGIYLKKEREAATQDPKLKPLKKEVVVYHFVKFIESGVDIVDKYYKRGYYYHEQLQNPPFSHCCGCLK